MRRPFTSRALPRFALAGLALLALGACGRRGPLEAPLGAGGVKGSAQGADEPATSVGAYAAPVVRRPRHDLITPPKDPFILDPLL